MTVRASRFTPEVLIAAPRRGRLWVNGDATAVLYTLSTYSFEEQKRTSKLLVTILPHIRTETLDDSGRASNPVWLNTSIGGERNSTVLFLREREDEKGVTDLVCCEDVLEHSLEHEPIA